MDYTFSYKLNNDEGEPHSRNALLELIKDQLKSLLDVVILTYEGQEIKVDGLKLLANRNTVYKLFENRNTNESAWSPDILGSTRIYEPRIELIKRQLENLQKVVSLEKDGVPVPVDSFRLRNLEDWLIESNCSPAEILEYSASRCDCNCIMCYNKGMPPSLALTNQPRTAEDELTEIKTRLKHFSPGKKQSLFPGFGCSYDVMAHPHFIEMLELVRSKTKEPLTISTNGRRLTEEMVAELSKYRPVYIVLSLNSSSVERRRKLMNDPDSRTAISSLKLLAEREIPFTVVIVPWPVDSVIDMCNDMSKTAHYADAHGARLIQINLPGYSRYFSTEELFDLNEVWRTCVEEVQKLRNEITCPIVLMPTMYEENLFFKQKNLPEVTGIIKNSPVARGGIKMGDILLKINNVQIKSRPHARDILFSAAKRRTMATIITISRRGQTYDINVNPADFNYPYSEEFDNHLGIVFMGTGLRLQYIEELINIIGRYRAKDVLFLSSALVKPTFEQILHESHLFGSSELRFTIKVPENRSMGGNIFMGDLLTVRDFIDCIKNYMTDTGTVPDLVVIPSSPFGLGQWGRDLTGRVYLDIEREVGVPVELLECDIIND